MTERVQRLRPVFWILGFMKPINALFFRLIIVVALFTEGPNTYSEADFATQHGG